MTGKVFVSGRFVKDIDISQHIFSAIPPIVDSASIRARGYNAVATTTGIVQVYIPALDVLVS